MKSKPSLGEESPNPNIKTQSIYSYEPSFADCCAVLGTTETIEKNEDAWLGGVPNVSTTNHNTTIPRFM
jgi:hypothetical protein